MLRGRQTRSVGLQIEFRRFFLCCRVQSLITVWIQAPQ